MNVRAVFRGGVGDFFLWLTRMVPMLEFHKDDNVSLAICSPWPEGVKAWTERLLPRKFDSIVVLPYGRPVPVQSMDGAFLGQDMVYHCDHWCGPRNTSSFKGELHAVDTVFKHFGVEWYPQLDIPGDAVGGTVLQVQGRSVGDVGSPAWWRKLARNFHPPIRILGQAPRPPREYGAFAQIKDPVGIYSAIKSAYAFVGLDSGFRNIAFTLKVPVIEIETPGKGYPSKAVFSPPAYRGRCIYSAESEQSIRAVLPLFRRKVTKRIQELGK